MVVEEGGVVWMFTWVGTAAYVQLLQPPRRLIHAKQTNEGEKKRREREAKCGTDRVCLWEEMVCSSGWAVPRSVP